MSVIKKSPLTEYLEKYETIYPGICIWWEEKVIPDQLSGIKIIYRFNKDFDVKGLGVFDLKQAKLCHLSLDLAVQGSGLGMTIMNLVKKEAEYYNMKEIGCHGPEILVDDFCRWSGALPKGTLHTFGRKDIKDIKMILPIWHSQQEK